jgi:hypothetical protein
MCRRPNPEHSTQQRREIQPIEAEIIRIIRLHLHYAWYLHVQVSLLFLFQQCLGSGLVGVVERVGISGGVALGVAPPTTLAHCFAIRGGLRPWADPLFFSVNYL